MPVISAIGRKSIKVRLIVLGIYLLLIAGSVTMIYPFMIMLSGTVKGNTDSDRMDPIPEFFYNEQVQFARFEEDRYQMLATESAAYGKTLYAYSSASLPDRGALDGMAPLDKFVKENIHSFPDYFYIIQSMANDRRLLSKNFRKFSDELQAECMTMKNYNKKYKACIKAWNEISCVNDVPLVREFSYDDSDPMVLRYLQFKKSIPDSEKVILNIDGFYQITQMKYPEVKNNNLSPFPILTETCPNGIGRKFWTRFVKENLNCMFVKVTPDGLNLFREYLDKKYSHAIAKMNRDNETQYQAFDSITISDQELRNNGLFTLYSDFIGHVCPAEYLKVDTPQIRYRAYIGDTTAQMPLIAYDYHIYQQTKRPWFWEQLTRNYYCVIQYITRYGRALMNTLIYIFLAITAALTVNPLAAYALSRFKLKNTYSILMFFMITMAFPGAVTMIPNFLLLKQFHMLNSIWALVLPGIANGYHIFILKGFFDSIPKDLYESAMIDGAGEWTMFWRFTMALSKPILALLTLGAFTHAYNAFMFALIICPDSKMWTLMVWLYQLQNGASQPIIYAALVLAAIPTLLVFIFAQNIIMRGIVVPVEK